MPTLADGRELRDAPLAERWSHPRATRLRPWTGADLLKVNLEDRHVVEGRTISTRDAVLDIGVPAETGEPEWKDEDEFEAAITAGRITPDEAEAIRAEGERDLVERPWPTGLESWQPPAGFVPPALPDGWDA